MTILVKLFFGGHALLRQLFILYIHFKMEVIVYLINNFYSPLNGQTKYPICEPLFSHNFWNIPKTWLCLPISTATPSPVPETNSLICCLASVINITSVSFSVHKETIEGLNTWNMHVQVLCTYPCIRERYLNVLLGYKYA